MNLENNINVCLACDDIYVKHASVVIASILINASPCDNLNFYILDGGISDQNIANIEKLKSIKLCNIHIIKVNDSLFDDYKQVKTHKYISVATYYRLKLPTLLPNVDKTLYLDCDFVVNTSLNSLYNIDLDNKPIAGVLDVKKSMVDKNPTYINAGMLLIDIKKMKELDLENKFLKWTQKNVNDITCGDQEIINEVCKGQIKLIDDEWNVQSSNFTNRSCYTNKPKGIHFISKKKPWHFGSYSYHKSYYFKYLQLTPWALKGVRKILWNQINEIASLLFYVGYRPLFLIRPKFYKALYYTYIRPILKGAKS